MGGRPDLVRDRTRPRRLRTPAADDRRLRPPPPGSGPGGHLVGADGEAEEQDDGREDDGPARDPGSIGDGPGSRATTITNATTTPAYRASNALGAGERGTTAEGEDEQQRTIADRRLHGPRRRGRTGELTVTAHGDRQSRRASASPTITTPEQLSLEAVVAPQGLDRSRRRPRRDGPGRPTACRWSPAGRGTPRATPRSSPRLHDHRRAHRAGTPAVTSLTRTA